MRGIGEMARDSGLTISALRFYDAEGVLSPAEVDPYTGYRRYAPEQLAEARIVARLRRVRMPLADIRMVLAARSGRDAALACTLLDQHVRRLEDSLSDVRRELSAVRALLRPHPKDAPMTALAPETATTRYRLPAADLARALATVRFAVSSDPELPMLRAVLFDLAADADTDPTSATTLRLVATDRYRLAVSGALTCLPADADTDASADADTDAPVSRQILVPAHLVDALRALLGSSTSSTSDDTGATVTLTITGTERFTLETPAGQIGGEPLPLDFPDYRRLLRTPAGHRVHLDAAAFRRSVEAIPPVDDTLTLLLLSAADSTDGPATDPGLTVATELSKADAATRADVVAVNREFLLDALAAAAAEHDGTPAQLALEIGGPVSPLVLAPARTAHAPGPLSLLMPVRLDDELHSA